MITFNTLLFRLRRPERIAVEIPKKGDSKDSNRAQQIICHTSTIYHITIVQPGLQTIKSHVFIGAAKNQQNFVVNRAIFGIRRPLLTVYQRHQIIVLQLTTCL